MYFNTNWGHDLFATTILRLKIQCLENKLFWSIAEGVQMAIFGETTPQF